jgi:hypothetical protein
MKKNGLRKFCFEAAAGDNYQILPLKLEHNLHDVLMYIKP